MGNILHVSPGGSSTTQGVDPNAPWSLARACQVIDNSPAPGDTIALAPGIYAEPFRPQVSGTPEAPIVYRPDGTGTVVIDGSRLAVATTISTQTPIETGWTLVNGNGILTYPDGSDSGSVGLVYRKTGVTQTVLGVFCDDPTDSTWMWTSLWDMRTQNANNTNPDLRLHDASANHNDFQTGIDGVVRQAHDWKGQFRQNFDGLYGPVDSIDIRLHDSVPPDAHNVYLVYGTAVDMLHLANQHDVVITGGSDKQLVIARSAGLARVTNCRGVEIRNLTAQHSGPYDAIRVENSTNTVIHHCVVRGAGSAGARQGYGVVVQNSDGVTVRDNDLRYAGTHALAVIDSANVQVTGNTLSQSSAGILLQGGGTTGFVVENNTVDSVGDPSTQIMQSVNSPGGGLTVQDAGNGYVRRNTYTNAGYGISLSTGSGTQYYNNTCYGCQDALHIEQTSSTQNGQFANNLFQNNIFAASSRYDLFCTIWNGVANNWWGNKIRYNDFATNTVSLVSGGDLSVNMTSTNIRTAASQSSVMILTGNVVSAPLMNGPSGGDYTLQSTSPCIDAGRSTDANGAALAGLSTDVAVVGTYKDIGRYEYGATTTPPTNQLPTCSLTLSASSIAVGGTVTISVIASDPDGSISSVLLNYGDGSTWTETASPASFSKTHTYSTANTYNVSAAATDNLGATGGSASKSLSVGSTSPPTNQLPTCLISASKTSGAAPLAVTISVSSSDADGTVSYCDLNFGDGTAVVHVTTSPTSFSQTHTYQTAGNYLASVTATDNLGATGPAANTPTITVTGTTGTGPTCTIAPSVGSVVVGQSVTFNCTVSSTTSPSPPPPTGTPTVQGPFGNVRVTVDSNAANDRSESSVAVSPTNPANLIATSKKFFNPTTYSFTVAAEYSTNGALSWTESPALVLPSGAGGTSDPVVTFDNLGNAYLIALPFQPGTSSDAAGTLIGITIYRSTNGGATWSNPLLIHSSTGDDKQWIVSDVGAGSPYVGNVYAAWDDGSTQRFARTTDHGTSWKGTGVNVAGTQIMSGYEYPQIFVGPSGVVHVCAISGSVFGYCRSTDGGNSFTGTTNVISGITNLGSAGLSAPNGYPELPGGTFRVLTLPSAATTTSSNLLVAWADYREGASRIYYRRSTDGGTTWQGSVSGQPLLTSGILSTQTGAQDFHPQIVGNANGVVACTFYELANFGGVYKIATVMALSFDHGATFTVRKTLTDQPWDPTIDAPLAHGQSQTTFIGEYFGLCEKNGTFTTVWTDTRTGIQELYCDRIIVT